MQVTETAAAGLKREYRVVVPIADLDAKVNERLTELKDRVRLNGFRPGKVPIAHLKRVYGRAVMAETIEEAVREANSSIVSDHGFKLAMDPKVVMPGPEGAITEVVAGKADLAYSVEIEILPTSLILPAGYKLTPDVQGHDYIYPHASGQIDPSYRIPLTGCGLSCTMTPTAARPTPTEATSSSTPAGSISRT